MKLSLSARSRLFGAGLLMALAAGCGGGGGGGGDAGHGGPPPGPPGAPVPPPPAPPEVRGWSKSFGSAAVVIGQAGFDQLDPTGTAATPLPTPWYSPAVSADGRLFVASGSLLLAFEQLNAENGPAATLTYDLNEAFLVQVAGGVSAQGSKLVVTAGHQVHIFNSAPVSQEDAPNVSSSTGAPGCSASQLRQPRSAFLTPQGQLVVADSFNHRVLIWNAVPDDGLLGNANIVLGQQNMTKCAENDVDGDGTTDSATAATMAFPSSVWSDGVRLLVADEANHRVLVWNTFPSEGDALSLLPSQILGQQNFTFVGPNGGQNTSSATSLLRPSSVDVSADGELAVADSGNNRILIWNSIPTDDDPRGQAANHVVGQSDFVHRHPNDASQSGTSGAVPSAKTLKDPIGVLFHGRDLIVNDHGNDRVLIWHEGD